VFFGVLPASAAIYKGQREFVTECKTCHKGGQSFFASYEVKYWKDMMDNKGEKLAYIHIKSEKAQKSWEYFKSTKYAKKSKHLKQFLVEYAKDSGNVPACN
jgi:hypothetical protein